MTWEKVKIRDLTAGAEAALAQVPAEKQDRVCHYAFLRAKQRGVKRVAKSDMEWSVAYEAASKTAYDICHTLIWQGFEGDELRNHPDYVTARKAQHKVFRNRK